LLDLVEEFRDHKKLSDSLDFSDMTRLSLEVVRQHPSVIDEFRSEFKMVLLDEYQDTSVGQRELMRAIFGDGHAVTAVGDPLQSIYTFRGTSPYNIDSFVNHFPNVDGSPAKLFTLPKTYRNGPNIVALANALSEPLRTPGVHPNVEPLVASELEINGKGDLRISNHERDYDEVQWIAGEMLKANAQGIPFEKMAVLLRRNEDIAWFYRHLTNLGVPSQVTSKQALLNIPEVAELVAYLRCIAEPAANEAWIRILTGARWRIGNRDLALIGKHASRLAAPEHQDSDRSIDDVLAKAVANVDSVDVVAYGDALLDIARNGHAALSASAIARIKVLVKEIDELRRFTGDELTDFVYRVASTTGLLHEVHSHVDRVHSGMNGTIRSLLNMISDFKSIDGSATIFSLLRWFYDSEKYGVQPTLPMVTHAGAVQLMTIHASKGLEFSVVSLPRFAAGIFPTSNNPDRWTGSAHAIAFALRDERINDAILLEYPPLGEDIPTKLKEEFSAAVSAIQDLEERRLAYVAVTRAEKILLVSSSYVIEDEEKIRENSEYLNTMHETALALPANDAEGHVEVFKWIPSDGIDIALVQPTSAMWPVPMNSPTMQSIRDVAAAVLAHPELKESSDSLVQGWDAAIASLEAELREDAVETRQLTMPAGLSVTQVQALNKDEAEFISRLLRPMPLPPAPAAAQGTAFHAWVEARARQQFGVGTFAVLSGQEDYDKEISITLDTATLKKFQANFESCEWASKVPVAVEHPFTIIVGGRQIRGKIDAVFQDGDDWIVVDWKTNEKATADDLQLSIYRHAWAEAQGVSPERVKAAFYYVAFNETQHAQSLMTREQISQLLNA
jgi:DNA helicase-2/ATP-dependent DNA helicase PcrA